MKSSRGRLTRCWTCMFHMDLYKYCFLAKSDILGGPHLSHRLERTCEGVWWFTKTTPLAIYTRSAKAVDHLWSGMSHKSIYISTLIEASTIYNPLSKGWLLVLKEWFRQLFFCSLAPRLSIGKSDQPDLDSYPIPHWCFPKRGEESGVTGFLAWEPPKMAAAAGCCHGIDGPFFCHSGPPKIEISYTNSFNSISRVSQQREQINHVSTHGMCMYTHTQWWLHWMDKHTYQKNSVSQQWSRYLPKFLRICEEQTAKIDHDGSRRQPLFKVS